MEGGEAVPKDACLGTGGNDGRGGLMTWPAGMEGGVVTSRKLEVIIAAGGDTPVTLLMVMLRGFGVEMY